MFSSIQAIFYLIVGFLAAIGLLVTLKVIFKTLKRMLTQDKEEQ